MMTRISATLLAMFFVFAAPLAASAKPRGHPEGAHPHHRFEPRQHRAARETADRHRDPLGIIQR